MTTTTEKLALELEQLQLKALADMARDDLFDDRKSTFDMPKNELVIRLGTAAAYEKDDRNRRAAIMQLRTRVIDGEFDQ
jgi:hypothetical protein